MISARSESNHPPSAPVPPLLSHFTFSLRMVSFLSKMGFQMHLHATSAHFERTVATAKFGQIFSLVDEQ